MQYEFRKGLSERHVQARTMEAWACATNAIDITDDITCADCELLCSSVQIFLKFIYQEISVR